jgi:hypothetical protein
LMIIADQGPGAGPRKIPDRAQGRRHGVTLYAP